MTGKCGTGRRAALVRQLAPLLALVGLSCVFGGLALAEAPRVLVLGDADPGLLDAVRIQLASVAEVRRAPALPAVELSERVELASERAAEHGAVLALWVEGPAELHDGRQQLVLYVVGDRQDRAVVDVLRARASDAPQVQRGLAIKVREVFEQVVMQPVSPEQPTLLHEHAPPLRRWGFGARLGFAGLAQDAKPSLQWGPVAGGGVFWRVGERTRVTAELAVRLDMPVESQRGSSRVELDGWTPGLSLALVRDERAVTYGASIGGRLRIVYADGISPLGARGEATRLVPALAASALGELALGRGFALRVGLGVEWSLRREQLTVNQRPVAELGRLRGELQVGVTLR